jgi:solute carrier family 25 aspartate/glutamate transporter 12/13
MDTFNAKGLVIPELSFPKMEQKPKLIRADNPPPIPLSHKFVVGAVAGILGTSVIYPVDLMKTQIQSSTNSSIVATVTRVFRSGGLYRGFSACLVGIAPEKAIKLAVNDGMRDYFVQNRNNGGKIMLHQEIISGSLAGFLQLLVTVPCELISKICFFLR